jgi:hypothetical protein
MHGADLVREATGRPASSKIRSDPRGTSEDIEMVDVFEGIEMVDVFENIFTVVLNCSWYKY